MEIARRGDDLTALGLELYYAGAEELEYQLKNNPVQVTAKHRGPQLRRPADECGYRHNRAADHPKISLSSFDCAGRLERAASVQAWSLEKGMIILSTAVRESVLLVC